MSVQEFIPIPEPHGEGRGDLAIMLTGGGARAAYQVGLLRGLARYFPEIHFQIITGVSAGAINAIFLATRNGSLAEKVEQLTELWSALTCDHVFRPNYAALLPLSLQQILPAHFVRRRRFVRALLLSELGSELQLAVAPTICRPELYTT